MTPFSVTLLLFAALNTFAATPATNNAPLKSLIVGGTDAVRGEFPFIASLQSPSYGGHFCGCSLIKKNWILTAGHCVEGITPDAIVLGLYKRNDMTGTETMHPVKIVQHPKYDANTMDFDFALIQIDKDSAFEPVMINENEIAIPKNASEALSSTVAGWGVVQENSYSLPNILQKVDVPLVDQATCNASYKNGITDRMICAGLTAGGKDSCQGDSGGPLVVTVADATSTHRLLVGVVSWGEGCARSNLYGVYSKVNSVAQWINDTTK